MCELQKSFPEDAIAAVERWCPYGWGAQHLQFSRTFPQDHLARSQKYFTEHLLFVKE